MTRGKLLVGTFVTAFAVGVTPAWAQRTGAGSATRDPGSAAERTGGAVDRGSSGSSSEGSTSSGGSSSTGSSSGGYSSPAPTSGMRSEGAREYVTAPMRPSERAERAEGQTRSRGDGGTRQPSGGSNGGGSRAVPRDSGGERAIGSNNRPMSTTSAESGGQDSSPSRRAVPAYSRPRGNSEATGTAVDRNYPLRGTGSDVFYSTYYPSLYGRYYWPGYGYGLGYYYDPLWYDPFAYGGYGYGGGYGGYGGAGYYGGYQGSYGSGSYTRTPTGALRLKIKPRHAQVFVDGFFVGVVDSFDGLFQKLGIDAGGHRIEVKAPGHETVQFDVLITPGETVTYKGELKPVQ